MTVRYFRTTDIFPKMPKIHCDAKALNLADAALLVLFVRYNFVSKGTRLQTASFSSWLPACLGPLVPARPYRKGALLAHFLHTFVRAGLIDSEGVFFTDPRLSRARKASALYPKRSCMAVLFVITLLASLGSSVSRSRRSSPNGLCNNVLLLPLLPFYTGGPSSPLLVGLMGPALARLAQSPYSFMMPHILCTARSC